MSASAISPFDWATPGRSISAAMPETGDFEHGARVIDLGIERARRRQSESAQSLSDERYAAMLRHPAARGGNSDRTQDLLSGRQATVSLSFLVRRVGLYLLALIVVVALSAGAGLLMRDSAYTGPTWQHSVSAGESLWSLAAGIKTSEPIEQVMEDIRQLNALESTTLQIGQELVLPAY